MTHFSESENFTPRTFAPVSTIPALAAALKCGAWTGSASTDTGDRLTGFGPGSYTLFNLLRPFGWVLVEASDDQMPYACVLVHDEARAALSYCEGDLTLTISATAGQWAAELRRFSAWYRAPVLASLGFAAPVWNFRAVEPETSAELTEIWAYACNDGAAYREFMASMRPLVSAYLRGTYSPEMGAPVFKRLLLDAWRGYMRDFHCYIPLSKLTDEGLSEWAAFMGDELIRTLWGMRWGEGTDWRGVSDIMKEECAALAALPVEVSA